MIDIHQVINSAGSGIKAIEPCAGPQTGGMTTRIAIQITDAKLDIRQEFSCHVLFVPPGQTEKGYEESVEAESIDWIAFPVHAWVQIKTPTVDMAAAYRVVVVLTQKSTGSELLRVESEGHLKYTFEQGITTLY